MRPRFKTNRVGTSGVYRSSEINKEVQPYIKVFGRLLPLTPIEVKIYESKTEIIWK